MMKMRVIENHARVVDTNTNVKIVIIIRTSRNVILRQCAKVQNLIQEKAIMETKKRLMM